MMKKLLVLTLVLGIVGLVNAGLAFDVNGTQAGDGDTVDINITTTPSYTVSIYNDAEVNGAVNIAWFGYNGQATVTSFSVVGGNLCGTWTMSDYGVDAGKYWYEIVNTVANPSGKTLQGSLFTLTLKGVAEGDVVFEVQNTDGGVLESMTIHQIPEPITMVLLGLGGLFIRRK